VHYCGGRAVESKLLFVNHDLGCGMEKEAKKCDDAEILRYSKKPCCKDEVIAIQLVEDIEIRALNNDSPTSLNSTDIIEENVAFNNPLNSNKYYSSIPDKPKISFRVLYQTFLL
jgi:hypothetical protein